MIRDLLENEDKTPQEEYEYLCGTVEGMKFEDAFKMLDGYNLDGKINAKGEVTLEFDIDFNGIRTTIFKEPDGTCEVWELYEELSTGKMNDEDEEDINIIYSKLQLDDTSPTIGNFDINSFKDKKVDAKFYGELTTKNKE